MRIRFHGRFQVQQHDGNGPVYEAGKSYDFVGFVEETYAQKYVRLGLAQVVAEDAAAVTAPETSGETAGDRRPSAVNDPDPDTVEIPDNWRDMKWGQLRSLASKLSPDPVDNKNEAIEAIEAELVRRNAAG